jgi:HK97 family phage prohead protease
MMQIAHPTGLRRKEGPFGTKTKDFALSVKAEDVKDDGSFHGYGSVFGVLDSYREIVEPGAFADSLVSIKETGRQLPCLWQHRTDSPIGGYTLLEEDERGLRCEGVLDIEFDPQAALAHKKLKAKRISGLSIGFYVREEVYDKVERITRLTKLDLVEISLVTFPANPAAQVEGVKSAVQRVRAAVAAGQMPDLKDFEGYLRDAGFSKAAACGIAGHGLRSMLRGDPEGESGTLSPNIAGEALDALRGFGFGAN